MSKSNPERSALRLLQGSNFAALFDVYVEHLVSRGYAASTFEIYLRGVAHFLHWVGGRCRGVVGIDAATVNRFVNRHLSHCHCGQQYARNRTISRQALALLLSVLRERSAVTVQTPAAGTMEAELADFERYLTDVCGLMPSTRSNYLWVVRRFLSQRFGARTVRIEALTPQDIRAFVARSSAHRSPISTRAIGVGVRSYLRFKAVGGVSVERLCAAIPEAARWRLSGLPRSLMPEEIERLLGAFDRKDSQGQRDYAMARCLVDLGLRAGETARLQLDDVNWRAATLQIPGKGRRVQILPLPPRLGDALAQYLRHGRPSTGSRAVFIRVSAPRNRPVTADTVRKVMSRAAHRCGLGASWKGTHRLRHSMAARLLNRGATLKAIADILRHRSFNTTRIYAKLDLPALRTVVLPWPGRPV
jgi:integrase/recombinase XerD